MVSAIIISKSKGIQGSLQRSREANSNLHQRRGKATHRKLPLHSFKEKNRVDLNILWYPFFQNPVPRHPAFLLDQDQLLSRSQDACVCCIIWQRIEEIGKFLRHFYKMMPLCALAAWSKQCGNQKENWQELVNKRHVMECATSAQNSSSTTKTTKKNDGKLQECFSSKHHLLSHAQWGISAVFQSYFFKKGSLKLNGTHCDGFDLKKCWHKGPIAMLT